MEKSPTPAQRRKQLLGAWRSDLKRTLEELAKRRDISKKQFEFFRTIFGKLEIHYRPKTFVTSFKGKRAVGKYQILGADSYSVAISHYQKFSSPQIKQINFDGNYYWINLGGGMREFFKRIKVSKSRRDIRR